MLKLEVKGKLEFNNMEYLVYPKFIIDEIVK